MTDDARRVHGWISGKVQGVWFRASTQEVAVGLKLSGWVRNLPDGRVEFLAEGAASAVGRLLAWVQRGGPPKGRVDDLELVDESPAGERGSFEIRP